MCTGIRAQCKNILFDLEYLQGLNDQEVLMTIINHHADPQLIQVQDTFLNH